MNIIFRKVLQIALKVKLKYATGAPIFQDNSEKYKKKFLFLFTALIRRVTHFSYLPGNFCSYHPA